MGSVEDLGPADARARWTNLTAAASRPSSDTPSGGARHGRDTATSDPARTRPPRRPIRPAPACPTADVRASCRRQTIRNDARRDARRDEILAGDRRITVVRERPVDESRPIDPRQRLGDEITVSNVLASTRRRGPPPARGLPRAGSGRGRTRTAPRRGRTVLRRGDSVPERRHGVVDRDAGTCGIQLECAAKSFDERRRQRSVRDTRRTSRRSARTISCRSWNVSARGATPPAGSRPSPAANQRRSSQHHRIRCDGRRERGRPSRSVDDDDQPGRTVSTTPRLRRAVSDNAAKRGIAHAGVVSARHTASVDPVVVTARPTISA